MTKSLSDTIIESCREYLLRQGYEKLDRRHARGQEYDSSTLGITVHLSSFADRQFPNRVVPHVVLAMNKGMLLYARSDGAFKLVHNDPAEAFMSQLGGIARRLHYGVYVSAVEVATRTYGRPLAVHFEVDLSQKLLAADFKSFTERKDEPKKRRR